MTDFPVLDAARPPAGQPGHRTIIDIFPALEPYLGELDYWVTMPVRLVHDPLGGIGIEVGPYTLDAADIKNLRAAIAGYDAVMGVGTTR